MANPEARLPKRPGMGSVGRSLYVTTNIVKMTRFSTSNVFQYDVTIHPELPPEKAKALFWHARKLLPATVSNGEPDKKIDLFVVFDGQKIAIANARLPESTMTFTVPYDEDEQSEMERLASTPAKPMPAGGNFGPRGRGGYQQRSQGRYSPPSTSRAPTSFHRLSPRSKAQQKEFTITFKEATTINFFELQRFCHAKADKSESIEHALAAIGIILRSVPSRHYLRIRDNIFSPNDRIKISNGLEIWRGFHQSARPMRCGSLGVNIDIATAAFRTGGKNLVDIAMDILDCKDPRNILPGLDILSKELKNVKVETNYRGEGVRRRYRIGKILSETPDRFRFDIKRENDTRNVSVAEYFMEQYEYRVRYGFLPCIKSSNGRIVVPMECVNVVPGQRFLKKLSARQTDDMLKTAKTNPNERRRQIEQALSSVELFKYETNDTARAFGIQVESQPSLMSVPARVLQSPELVFGNTSLRANNGSWMLKNVEFYSSPVVRSIGFVWFAPKGQYEAEAIAHALVRKWQRYGINICAKHIPVHIANINPQNVATDVSTAMMTCFKETEKKNGTRPSILVCIIPAIGNSKKGNTAIYAAVKKISLCTAGVITQCLVDRNVANAQDINDQYAGNVATKVAIKLGGKVNKVRQMPPLMSRPTLILGIDVSHPPPGSAAPSIVALVAGIDPESTRFVPFVKLQLSRSEGVLELKAMVIEALKAFRKNNLINGIPISPEKIIVYRDGVSSGQFENILDLEVAAIQDACHELNLNNIGVTFIICQKRHHVRFFPQDNGPGGDRTGNCSPGTLIEDTITHPFEYDFFLQSHAGLLGTSRPTHYHVIYDDNKIRPDDLQALTYNLTYLSGRATRSLSIASPVYFAHHLADKAKLLLDDNFSDIASTSTASGQRGPSDPNNPSNPSGKTPVEATLLPLACPIADAYSMFYM
ncbi:Piwi domain-containing protein [Polychytrium aggregatum]|uniref:Piwi domain-containing protein n=1 Tax=Polychytrium aggregatum TaxID=110093 RepID=UPI0022FE4C69|nr:Piwi domain-containing protein [Polychytrium aggregatum]KAI9193484.1 Piwi domain-containing protein [Polychytrium aggregatum]